MQPHAECEEGQGWWMVKHVYPTPWLRWRKYGNVMLFYTAHRKTSTFTEHAHGAWNRIWITQTNKQYTYRS